MLIEQVDMSINIPNRRTLYPYFVVLASRVGPLVTKLWCERLMIAGIMKLLMRDIQKDELENTT